MQLPESYRNEKLRRARKRNWALYVARGMAANLKLFKPLINEVDFARLYNAIDFVIKDLEDMY